MAVQSVNIFNLAHVAYSARAAGVNLRRPWPLVSKAGFDWRDNTPAVRHIRAGWDAVPDSEDADKDNRQRRNLANFAMILEQEASRITPEWLEHLKGLTALASKGSDAEKKKAKADIKVMLNRAGFDEAEAAANPPPAPAPKPVAKPVADSPVAAKPTPAPIPAPAAKAAPSDDGFDRRLLDAVLSGALSADEAKALLKAKALGL